MIEVTLEQAAADLEQIIQRARRDNEEIAITMGHIAVARVVLLKQTNRMRPQFGSAEGLVTVPPDFDATPEDFAEYR